MTAASRNAGKTSSIFRSSRVETSRAWRRKPDRRARPRIDSSSYETGPLLPEEGARFIAMPNSETNSGLSALLARLEALDVERAALVAEIEATRRKTIECSVPPSVYRDAVRVDPPFRQRKVRSGETAFRASGADQEIQIRPACRNEFRATRHSRDIPRARQQRRAQLANFRRYSPRARRRSFTGRDYGAHRPSRSARDAPRALRKTSRRPVRRIE